MSEAKREPGPEALAYAQALKEIFSRLEKSQREVARLLLIDASVLSRFLSGKPSRDSAPDTVAAKEHAEALVHLVRNSRATVTDLEVAELHKLRRTAQAASRRRDAVIDSFREQLHLLEVEADSCRGELEGARLGKARLVEKIECLSRQLREARQRYERTKARAEETTTRLEQAVRLGNEAEASASADREKLLAATEYARESEAQLETQGEELRQLRREIGVLRRQVQRLTAEAGVSAPRPVAKVAKQVSVAQSSGDAASGHRSVLRVEGLNADAPWDAFNPLEYIHHNYLHMQAYDEALVSQVRDYFSDHFEGRDRDLSGIDVGTGPNLYPALTMLPWAREITLLELSTTNVNFLKSQLSYYDSHWDQFWDVLNRRSTYNNTGDPRELFRRYAHVRRGDIFDLGSESGRWDVGTMFFVAESITRSIHEFQHAVYCFIHSLKPGAPFAAAFMEESMGYRVGQVEFPACSVSKAHVEDVFSRITQEMSVRRIGGANTIRSGDAGMLLVCGRR